MMPPRATALTDRFRELHQAGCFVIPNPWDLGSARVLSQLGFKALAPPGADWRTGVLLTGRSEGFLAGRR